MVVLRKHGSVFVVAAVRCVLCCVPENMVDFDKRAVKNGRRKSWLSECIEIDIQRYAYGVTLLTTTTSLYSFERIELTLDC